MKFTCDRDVLRNAVSALAPLCVHRGRPIMENIHVESEENGKSMLLTCVHEKHQRAAIQVPASVTAGGRMLIPTKRIAQILREASDQTVAMKWAKDKLTVSCGTAKFVLQAASPTEYPVWMTQEPDTELVVETNSTSLKRALKHAMTAMDEDATRYAFNSVGIDINSCDGQSITMFATNSKHMVLRSLPVRANQSMHEYDPAAVCKLPSTVCKLLMNIFDDDTPVTMLLSHGTYDIHSQHNGVQGATTSGRLPNYRKIVEIPKRQIATFRPMDVVPAARRASVMTTTLERGVELKFGDNELQMHTQVSDVGSADLTAIVSCSESHNTRFDVSMLLTALMNMPQDEVVSVLQNNPGDVMAIVADGRKHLLMPLEIAT